VDFVHYDLGRVEGGRTVEVTLSGSAANVLLLDAQNFVRYRSGREAQYYGGYYDRSPVLIPIPHAAHWHVAIDMGGYSGAVRPSVNVV
jgi:hypothetical protein